MNPSKKEEKIGTKEEYEKKAGGEEKIENWMEIQGRLRDSDRTFRTKDKRMKLIPSM